MVNKYFYKHSLHHKNMLYLISLGLNDEKDITVKGLEVVKKSKEVYLEEYTSKMQITKEKLEKYYGKKIITVDRDFVEKSIETLFEKARKEDIAFLVQGDIHTATTHIDLFLRAKKNRVPVKVIFNASILTAIGTTGLSLYNFGKCISIPFNNENLLSPYMSLMVNQKNGMHTLFLLDLDPKNNKFLTIREGLYYLKNKGLDENTVVLGCARIGNDDQVIKSGKLKEIMKCDFGQPPYCIIIPGRVHFIEKEALDLWK